QHLIAGGFDHELEFWRKRLENSPSFSFGSGTASEDDTGATKAIELEPDLTRRVRAIGREFKSTPFMVLLAGFQIVAHHFSRATDVVVGTDIAHRDRLEWEETVGLFVNQLVLRVHLGGNPSYVQILEAVRRACLEAYAHQNVPFALLAARLR